MRQKEREAADKAGGTMKVKAKHKTDDGEKVRNDCGDDVSSLDLWCIVHLGVFAAMTSRSLTTNFC